MATLEFLASVAILGAAAIVLGLMIYVGAVICLQAWDGRRPLLLLDVLRRHGIEVVPGPARSAEYEAARRACAACSSKARCREWLAYGPPDGYKTFCPNRGFIERSRNSLKR